MTADLYVQLALGLAGALSGGIGVYIAIRIQVDRAMSLATSAHDNANRAHSRIDNLLMKEQA